MSDKQIDQFRKMLDPKNWPMRPGRTWLIVQGEIIQYRTEDPLEERVFHPLHSGKFQ